MVGENIAQSAALTLVSVLALQSLGEDDPLAVTQYGLLRCAADLPITSVRWVDGHAYGQGGLRLMYLADGGFGLVACCGPGVVVGPGRGSARAPRAGLRLRSRGRRASG